MFGTARFLHPDPGHASRPGLDRTDIEMKTSALTGATVSPLHSLLAHYVTGGIEEPVWQRFMQILDKDALSIPDRMAYARYLNDHLAGRSQEAARGPIGEEMKGLLSDLRATRAA